MDEIPEDCVKELLFKNDDVCSAVLKYCNSGSIFDFYEMFYCTLNQSFMFYPFAVILA
jgi:hypothetical protein